MFVFVFFLLASLAQGLSERDTSCPVNCFKCESGQCQGCNSGWYGLDCSSECPVCRGGCNQDTGQCHCPHNKWGSNCSEDCPEHCRANQGGVCNRDTGLCDGGCRDGFFGETCTDSCGKCLNGFCSQESGKCVGGCEEKFGGDLCNARCHRLCITCGSNGMCVPKDLPVFDPTVHETEDIPVYHTRAPVTGPSKQTIDLIIGIMFGVFVLTVFVVICLFFHRQKCFALCKGKSKEEPMYEHDLFGSPRISRSYLKLNKLGEEGAEV